MTTYDFIQLTLLLLACYGCFWRGIKVGVDMAIERLIEDGLVDPEKLKKFIKTL